ncbi:MAG: hypothetical protein AABW75_00725 [Nanoarchaeota archaeon]
MREKHKDFKNAESILEASEKQMKFTLKQESTDESAFNIIRNIYECFRMLGDALLVSRGKKSEDHVDQVKALEILEVKTSRPIKLVDNLRRMRHNINYYGYSPTKIEADDAISFAHACFEPILKAVLKEIKV